MKELNSTVSSKGQVTIPAEIRRYLGINDGDSLSFVLDEDGAVRLKVARYPSIASLRGAAGSLDKKLSWQEIMDTAREDKAGSFLVNE